MNFRIGKDDCRNLDISSNREWLLTNGLGGYAIGTVSGINTRRYHGLLVASVDPPTERRIGLAAMEAFVDIDGTSYPLSSNQYLGAIYPGGYCLLNSFSAGASIRWNFELPDGVISKLLNLHDVENSVTITWQNYTSKPTKVTLRPLVCDRSHHENFRKSDSYPRVESFQNGISAIDSLSFIHPGKTAVPVGDWYFNFEHRQELLRGLDAYDDLYCPFELEIVLAPSESYSFTCSWGFESTPAVPVQELAKHDDLRKSLIATAAKFLVKGKGRSTIIAGYPWFTDWGRDTMISLPGICLCTEKFDVARSILHDFASQMSQGLIPNRFVESGEPEYNTADATLWFVNACYKTLLADWNQAFAKGIFPSLIEVFEWHMKGTHFGIVVDPRDGLLTQGAEGKQLTWMDAKVGDWVVTPRRGKAIELCALWYNACRSIAWIASKLQVDVKDPLEAAVKAQSYFESLFWDPNKRHYRDVVDPEDSALRPNQLIAFSLPFPIAQDENARIAIDTIRRELLTPVGLRTLGRSEPGYRGRFEGPLAELDSAYHQGTVWPWLLGPYWTSCARLFGDTDSILEEVKSCSELMTQLGLGGIAEVYDGDAPHRPNGCPYQAWSVAEILRVLVEDLNR